MTLIPLVNYGTSISRLKYFAFEIIGNVLYLKNRFNTAYGIAKTI